MSPKESLFWADQIAELILNRKKYNYIDKKIKLPKILTIKSSTSISGVPHVGNASDVIRHDAVVRALKDKKKKVRFIWVAEDMDALRKVPAGIPKNFEKYLGMPVADIPCPEGDCKTYSEHFCNKFINSLRENFGTNPEFLSTAEHYRKGLFNKDIKIILENIDTVKSILNKTRKKELPEDWSPWKPVCENCGKLMTTQASSLEGTAVKYSCEDYEFKPFAGEAYTKLKGCGFKGDSDITKGNGKLLWRVEWGMLWNAWKVVLEGAGKEHFMSGGSFWSAGEIAEKVLDWPEPYPEENSIQPYEYLTVSGEKMSASLGNVVSTWEWPEFSPPQILRMLFIKRPRKVRDFAYKDIPRYVDEFDKMQRIYFEKEKIEDEKESAQLKRLYEMSEIQIPKSMPTQVPFSYAAIIVQLAPKEKVLERAVEILKSTGHIKKSADKKIIEQRLDLARNWVERYADENYKIELLEKLTPEIKSELNENQKQALKKVGKELSKFTGKADEFDAKLYEISKESGLSSKEFFQAAYTLLLGKKSGPRLAPFLLCIDKKFIVKRFTEL